MRNNSEGTLCTMVRRAILALPLVGAIAHTAIADDVRARGATAVLVEAPSRCER
jgi:hypothetical protein